MTIRRKILLLGTCIPILAAGLMLSVAVIFLDRVQDRAARSAFAESERMVEWVIHIRRMELENEAQRVGMMPVLRAVIEAGDPATLRDTAREWKERLGVSFFDIFFLDGKLAACACDRHDTLSSDHAFTERALSGPASALGPGGEAPVILAASTLGTPPDHTGWLVLGADLDNRIARDIHGATGIEASFVTGKPVPARASLAAVVAVPGRHGQVTSIGTHLVKTSPLAGASAEPVGHLVMRYSLAENSRSKVVFIGSLLGIGALVMLLALAVGMRVVRGMTMPLSVLTATANEIASSRDLSRRTPVSGTDEIGQLGTSLNYLLGELQDSEKALIETQAHLVQSAKLSALGEMAAGIAHEINNPLAVITGYAAQLRRQLAAPATTAPQMDALVVKIEAMSGRIAKIVKSLLLFSRDGSSEPLAPVKVSEILSETLALCEDRFKRQGVPLSVSPVPADLVLWCQQVPLCQVLVNLLNNAYDAVASLPEKWVRVDVEMRGCDVVFQVTDSGPGIPAEVRKKLTQPFFTTKASGKGTGLGLSISARILERHRGSLEVAADCPNTRFVMRVPRAKSPAEPRKVDLETP